MANGTIEDVGGSFKRFLKNAPKEMRSAAETATKKTAEAMRDRMEALVPVGPDAPHIKDALTVYQRGSRAEVGIINGSEPASPGSSASLADVALYNEYNPNRQPFMRPAAEAENAAFTKRATDAVQRAARNLSGGT